MEMDTPFLKGSILEEGMVRLTWEGPWRDGKKCMHPLVMLMLGSKNLFPCTVNLPHLRKPANAVVTEPSKLSWPSKDK